MGIYREALQQDKPPDISANDEPGRIKYGWALSADQPLAHAGETGVFFRVGWNDGRTESFAYTEADEHLSLGVQVSGALWGRASDVVGLGGAIEGLSSDHRAYLEAGGLGFVLGDGRLNYGAESVVEIYYRMQLGRYLQVTPDYQAFENPGFNRDRGPAHVLSLRARVVWLP
jgi:carbohydrate-selective porin OprB